MFALPFGLLEIFSKTHTHPHTWVWLCRRHPQANTLDDHHRQTSDKRSTQAHSFQTNITDNAAQQALKEQLAL
jgi:hypothetical protein